MELLEKEIWRKVLLQWFQFTCKFLNVCYLYRISYVVQIEKKGGKHKVVAMVIKATFRQILKKQLLNRITKRNQFLDVLKQKMERKKVSSGVPKIIKKKTFVNLLLYHKHNILLLFDIYFICHYIFIIFS